MVVGLVIRRKSGGVVTDGILKRCASSPEDPYTRDAICTAGLGLLAGAAAVQEVLQFQPERLVRPLEKNFGAFVVVGQVRGDGLLVEDDLGFQFVKDEHALFTSNDQFSFDLRPEP